MLTPCFSFVTCYSECHSLPIPRHHGNVNARKEETYSRQLILVSGLVKTHRNWVTQEGILYQPKGHERDKNGSCKRREKKIADLSCWEKRKGGFEGKNNGFHQPETQIVNPGPLCSSPCWDPCLTPTELRDPMQALLRHHLKPAAGPPGYTTGLRTHFPGETNRDQPPRINFV